MKRYALFSLVLFLLIFAGCKQSTTDDSYDMTGAWSGTIRFASLGVSSVINYTFTQASGNVTGTFTTDRGRTGTFTGTLSGSSLPGTMTFTDACNGTATLTGTLKNADSLDGNGTATDCDGGNSYTLSIQR